MTRSLILWALFARIAFANPQAAPAEVEAVPEEVEPKPVEIEPTPVEAEAAPEEVEVVPAPVEIEPTPVEVVPAPVEIEPTPVEVEVETAPTVEAHPRQDAQITGTPLLRDRSPPKASPSSGASWSWPLAPTPSLWGAITFGLFAALFHFLARAANSARHGLARAGVLPFIFRVADGGGRTMSLLFGLWALLHLVPRSLAPLVSIGMAGGAVAVGWSLRGFAADVVCGVGLLFGRSVQRDQHLTMDGTSGRVLRVGLFSTVLWTADGQLVRIPNRRLSSDVVRASERGRPAVEVQVRLPVEGVVSNQLELLRNCALLSPYVEVDCAPEVWRDAQNTHVWHVRVNLGNAKWGQAFRAAFRAAVDQTFSPAATE